MTVRIITADVFEGLAKLDDESVDIVVTSPPYWGLRKYLPDGAMRLRADLSEDEVAYVKSELKKAGVI